MSKGLYTILAVVLVVIIAAGSFYGGTLFGKSQAQTTGVASGAFPGGAAFAGAPGTVGTPGARGQRGALAGNMTFGTIKEIGDGMLILTDSNGKDTQIKVTDTTLIEKNASVKLSDLTPGETLMVSGSAAADGTVTARSMQVAQQGRFGFGGGTNGAPGDPNAPNVMPTPAQ
mgnify:CR=1 FL=1